MPTSQDILDQYNNECPDCGDSIKLDVVDGDECENCGHVFWSTIMFSSEEEYYD